MASDRQIQYDQEQQSNVRKAELAARLKAIGEETSKVSILSHVSENIV
jgi:hypothetical protein